MRAPTFLIGTLTDGRQAWAAIDPQVKHVGAAIADRRFSAYLTPFPDERSARDALSAAGVREVHAEERRQGRRG